MVASDVRHHLRQARLRVTAPRLAVLQWLAGHPARFERRTGGNHHHVVCHSCGRTEDGRTEDVDCATTVCPCLTPNDDHGYLLDEAELVFWGSCPRCQALAQDSANDYRMTTDRNSYHSQEALQ